MPHKKKGGGTGWGGGCIIVAYVGKPGFFWREGGVCWCMWGFLEFHSGGIR